MSVRVLQANATCSKCDIHQDSRRSQTLLLREAVKDFSNTLQEATGFTSLFPVYGKLPYESRNADPVLTIENS